MRRCTRRGRGGGGGRTDTRGIVRTVPAPRDQTQTPTLQQTKKGTFFYNFYTFCSFFYIFEINDLENTYKKVGKIVKIKQKGANTNQNV